MQFNGVVNLTHKQMDTIQSWLCKAFACDSIDLHDGLVGVDGVTPKYINKAEDI